MASTPLAVSTSAKRGSTTSQSIQCRLSPAVTRPYAAPNCSILRASSIWRAPPSASASRAFGAKWHGLGEVDGSTQSGLLDTGTPPAHRVPFATESRVYAAAHGAS